MGIGGLRKWALKAYSPISSHCNHVLWLWICLSLSMEVASEGLLYHISMFSGPFSLSLRK
jgi:hypothetical protein